MLYNLIRYDTWGNAREGFEVNNAFYTGQQIQVDELLTDKAINRRIGLKGYDAKGCIWEGDFGYNLYGSLKNGKYLFELRPVLTVHNGEELLAQMN